MSPVVQIRQGLARQLPPCSDCDYISDGAPACATRITSVIEAVPSRTAGLVARHRAAHQLLDQPVVFNDPLALPIAGPDTFADRQPHGESLTVFEVDFPATQAWKRQRLAASGIAVPRSLRFVPVDFERQTAFDGLASAGFDAQAPALFSWLGVTMYLFEASVMSVLESIAGLRRGSGVVFDYATDSAGLAEQARRVVELMAERGAAADEPWTRFFDPAPLGRSLHEIGFTHIEDLDGAAINQRYFGQRQDGLHVGSIGHLLYAEI